jgi:hypothetical protein
MNSAIQLSHNELKAEACFHLILTKFCILKLMNEKIMFIEILPVDLIDFQE